MAYIHIPKAWEDRSLKATEESVYQNRRRFIKDLSLLGIGAAVSPSILAQQMQQEEAPSFTFEGQEQYYPAKRNERYTLDRGITKESVASQYNNFYEFIHPNDPNIYNVYKYVNTFDTSDWTIKVGGMCENKGTFHLGDLIKEFGTEERTYRFRCVERWAMAVPWTGFPMAKLMSFLKPKAKARFVRFTSFSDPKQMPGVKNQDWYPWPYQEGLSLEEAMNEVAFMATGIYGKPLPKQHGAPIRCVTPWKYGYKNIKSVVKIDFTRFQPKTFWNSVTPLEYPFVSNVDPGVPHPRWSQAEEYMIPNGRKRPTLKYNGYGEFVAGLYE